MKRAIKSALLTVGLAGVVTALSVAPSFATPPSGLTNIPLARGTDTSHARFRLQPGTDVAMAQITVAPGGSSGWHSHPGGAVIVVKEGALTVYSSTRADEERAPGRSTRSFGRHCQATTYSAGQAFVERPGEVDQVVNTGQVPYVLYVTFLNVPPGASPRTDEPDPGTCPGV